MTNLSRVAILLLALCYVTSGYGQTKLEQSKSELKSGSGYTPKHYRTSSGSSSGSSAYDDPIKNMFVEAFFLLTVYSVVGNYPYEDHLHNELTPYPYFDSRSGNYKGDDTSPYLLKPFRFDIAEQFMVGGSGVWGNHLNMQLRPFQYAYLQTDYIQLLESDNSNANPSSLSLFYINLCYDRIRFSRFNLGWTVGASYVGNEVRKWGLSFGLNAAAFFNKNISIYTSMRWSAINNQPVNTFEAKLRYHRERFYYSLGYENLKIATPTYNLLTVGAGVYL
jgi:hypothetical protein